MIIGIYQQLIAAVNGIFHHPKKSAAFLLAFIAGAGIGILALSGLINRVLEDPQLGLILRFFFVGAVAGGIPFIFKRAVSERYTYSILAYVVVGILLVGVIVLLPEGTFSVYDSKGIAGAIIQLAGGIILALDMILPGISTSHLMYTLGMYEQVIGCITSFQIIKLIPMALGTIIGIFLFSALIERLLDKYPRQTYLVILGFMIGSVYELLPKHAGGNLFLCCLSGITGFLIMYLIAGREEK